MTTVRQIEMSDPLYQQERELRNKILLRPVGTPDFGWEHNDPHSAHFVAVKDCGQVVGCALLYQNPETPHTARLMQMAVDDTCQGQGIGRLLIGALLAYARQIELPEVTCHARGNVVGFYEGLGFEAYGEPFVEVGITHRYMRIPLS